MNNESIYMSVDHATVFSETLEYMASPFFLMIFCPLKGLCESRVAMRRPGFNGKVSMRGARCRFQECIGSVPGGQHRKGGCVGSLGGHGVDKGEVVNLKSFPR